MKGKIRSLLFSVLCLSLLFSLSGIAFAQEKIIKIGTLFPLTGPAAVSGQNCQAAVEAVVEVINNKYNIKGCPLADKQGVLGGYKFFVVGADHQGKPEPVICVELGRARRVTISATASAALVTAVLRALR